MKEYHKIQTVYVRDPDNGYKTLLDGVFSKPEFKLLKDIEWVCTEKIDGTNIRIMWDGLDVRFGGKTDRAQIPSFLLDTLKNTFTSDKMNECFPDTNNVCLYGEGYGKKIQTGDNYLHDSTDFILFDVKIGSMWLTRGSCEDISEKLGINIVPIVGVMNLLDAIEYVKVGYKSIIAENKDYIAEGLIMKPIVTLFNRRFERVISKVKYKDFLRQ